MARFAYFADLPGGAVLEWRDGREACGVDLFGATRYRDAPARVRHDGPGRVFGWRDGAWVKVTRQVELKATPSRHRCDVRCLHATGRTMRCECACGGRNHGRGALVCSEA